MSAVKYQGTWRQVDTIKVRKNGAWVDSAGVYARSENEWYLVDFNAEQLGPAYHTWVIYATDPYAFTFADKGITLDSDNAGYVGIRTGNRKELPVLGVDIASNQDLVGFNWSTFGESVDVKLISDNGYFFKNNTGAVKTINAVVFINGALSPLMHTYNYKWTTNGQQIYTSNAGDFLGTTLVGGSYPADPLATNGLNFQAIQIDFTDVNDGDILNLTCEVSGI